MAIMDRGKLQMTVLWYAHMVRLAAYKDSSNLATSMPTLVSKPAGTVRQTFEEV